MFYLIFKSYESVVVVIFTIEVCFAGYKFVIWRGDRRLSTEGCHHEI
jgi:hypothetical protein